MASPESRQSSRSGADDGEDTKTTRMHNSPTLGPLEAAKVAFKRLRE